MVATLIVHCAFYYRYSSCSWAGADVEFQRVDSIHGEFVVPENRSLGRCRCRCRSCYRTEESGGNYSTRVIIKILILLADGTMDPRLRPTSPRNSSAFDLTASDATLAYSFCNCVNSLCAVICQLSLSALQQAYDATLTRCSCGEGKSLRPIMAKPKPET
jgi:hypothetical protein